MVRVKIKKQGRIWRTLVSKRWWDFVIGWIRKRRMCIPGFSFVGSNCTIYQCSEICLLTEDLSCAGHARRYSEVSNTGTAVYNVWFLKIVYTGQVEWNERGILDEGRLVKSSKGISVGVSMVNSQYPEKTYCTFSIFHFFTFLLQFKPNPL